MNLLFVSMEVLDQTHEYHTYHKRLSTVNNV